MNAITVIPKRRESARLETVAEPETNDRLVLVETLLIGVCGTDREILNGNYGSPAPGRTRLVLGHESLGRVIQAPAGSGLVPGDLVAGIVRRPDPVPCPNCAIGEWDMCRNGLYSERGINQLDGFASERWSSEPEFVVKVDPRLADAAILLEPTSVLAKAWEHIERIGGRALWTPRRVLVTGAGPIGLLAALFGVSRGLEVHVLDLATSGPKPRIVAELGASYHTGSIHDLSLEPDVILECTGVGTVVFDAIEKVSAGGVVCLTGVSSGGRTISVDASALNREIVLENAVVFGSVNANRRHYEAAAMALASADPQWLARLVTRKEPLARWSDALERRPDDVKTVIEFSR